METREVLILRVWIGCLACYNEGRLVGEWFDAVGAGEVTTYDIHGAHSRADSHDELWCFDHECIPVSGELSPMEAAKWGEVFDALAGEDRAALYVWVDSGTYVSEGDSDLPSVSEFEDQYCGMWDSFDDYAYQLADDMCLLENIPEEVSRYFHWEAWIRDLKFDYTVHYDPNGGGLVK